MRTRTTPSAPRYVARDLVVAAAVALALVGSLASPAQAAIIQRVYGADRFITSTEVSARLNPTGAPAVVIASGENWPDALAGAPLAAVFGTSVLLARQGELPPDVADEVSRLGATHAYVLGGPAALSSRVVADLYAAGIATVTRLGGDDRYETAQLIALEIEAQGSTDVDTLYIATGDNFPDALAAGPFAGAFEWPILLVRRNSVPAATLEAIGSLGVSKAYVLGGPSAIGSSVLSDLPSPTRLAGDERYETARVVAEHGLSQGGVDYSLYIASGETFADALAAGPIAAPGPFALLLVRSHSLPSPTAQFMTAHSAAIGTIVIVGGPAAVSEQTRAAIQQACPT